MLDNILLNLPFYVLKPKIFAPTVMSINIMNFISSLPVNKKPF